ncbi:MAG: hypothetical protein J6T06_02395, partial [Victivallales bacterium]|nr:hypothetical protein [Victivallales bacterium]
GFADPNNTIPTSSRIAEASPIQLETDIPTFEISQADIDAGLPIFILLAKSGLCKTSSDARRLVKGGGCSIDDRKITEEKYQITANDFVDGSFTLKAGKKSRKRIKLA